MMIENIDDLKWALDALRANADAYSLANRYYDGDHRLTFATEKFRNTFGRLFSSLAINMCPVCVDVPADRLQIEGFQVAAQGEGGTQATDDVIREIWRRNRMNKRAGEVHAEMLRSGDSYVIVDWENPESPGTNRATIYPNPAGRVAVKYDPENPGHIKKAAKWWSEEDGKSFRIRLNLYYPDRIEKYITNSRKYSDLPTRPNDFAPIEGDWSIVNPHKKVPVFHFANNADIGSSGKSELRDIIPVQDALNKTVCDGLVAMEFQAFRQRYVAGMEVPTDDNGNPVPPFQGGIDRLWFIPPQKDVEGKPLPPGEAQPVNIGDLDAADLQQFISMKETFKNDVSTISGIPSHYFMDAKGGWPSGESLKTAEQRLTSKVADRQVSAGNVWEDVMRFCLEIEGQGDVQVEAQWKDTGPRSEREEIENASTKVEKLGVPRKQAWRELRYKPDQIEQMEGEGLDELRQAQTVPVPTVARNGAN